MRLSCLGASASRCVVIVESNEVSLFVGVIMTSYRAQQVCGSRAITVRFLASSLLVSSVAFAQVGASVEGVVQDQSGAVVGNAAVSMTNTETGQVRESVTDAAGRYQIFGLGPGERYEIRAQANGFRPDVRVLSSVIAGERR